MTERQARGLWATAIHEAGHVMSCQALGVPVESATIVPNKSRNGYVRHDGLCGWEQGVVICLAGHAAELEFFGRDSLFRYSSDWKKATDYIRSRVKFAKAEAAGVPTFERDIKVRYSYRNGKLINHVSEWRKATRVTKKDLAPVARRLRAKTARLTRKHHAYIEQVAKLLVEKGTLTGEEIPQLRRRCAEIEEDL